MKQLITQLTAFFGKSLFPLIVMILLAGLTLASSVLGANKVIKDFQNPTIPVPEIKNGSLVTEPEEKSPTGNPQPTPTETKNAEQNNRCLVTLFGQQYDVTTLKNEHAGGDVFVCGTDQTALYKGKHGTDLTKMKKYLVTEEGNLVTPTPSGNKLQDDEDEEEEEEKMKEDDENEKGVEMKRV